MNQTLQKLRLGLAALVFATTSLALHAAPPGTGIQAQAALYISYGTPIEVEPGVWVSVGDVMLPVATSFSVLHAPSGQPLGRFSTAADGVVAVSLPPGKYLVVPDALTYPAFPSSHSISTQPIEVTVSAKKLTHALILYYQQGPSSVNSGMVD
jgi:hypothetical protein